MKRLLSFLLAVRGDIFKLLPMKESQEKGIENHIDDYIDGLIINLQGGASEYPDLAIEKKYLYAINNLQYIRKNEVGFKQWRRIVLGMTTDIDTLCKMYDGGECDGK